MGAALDTGKGKKGVRPNINVTPLVDVVLVLLIIFMVIAPMMVKQFWLHVPKKEAAAAESEPAAERSATTFKKLGPMRNFPSLSSGGER